ncbi:site-specific integrase [Sinanaerobacter chloroacetimidivorans]|uniref:Site-specific integrase n=1 Tax=Sinanaerobacter chloroacetimidivorans TaxID=2818044 RepID=A0A8J7W4T6_9FIRM|nr:site-specific integrase [Sinanaerobacter chloroacetimidivorans]MBR0599056.1 site-specific integrase [Sinanaerobacter chloroacetimidivorans]
METTKRKDNKGRILRKGESQRKDLTYMYRWTDHNGKRQCIYANDLNDLREHEKLISQELAVGVSRNTATLSEQIELYLATKNNLASSTYENYKYYYNHVIKNNKIGNMKIVDIKKSNILMFYKDCAKLGYQNGTIKILQKIIRPALELACDDNVIYKNPCSGCMKEYEDDMEKKYSLTIEQEKEFLDRLNSRPRMKRYRPMYEIVLKTGLRISEVAGLTWNDINFEDKTLNINHQVQYRFKSEKGHVEYYATKTKTKAGKRIIPMSIEVYNLFQEQRKIWLATKKDVEFNVDGYKNFVFLSHVTGKCINHNNIRRMLRTIVDMNSERDIQLPNISPHILRHTACTRLAEQGCEIRVLQYLMGHADIRATMKIYNHVDIERARKEIERVQIPTPITPNLHQLPVTL